LVWYGAGVALTLVSATQFYCLGICMIIETHNLEVVVLCGGQGSRLGTLTSNMQKCMLEVNGKPFLTYIVGQLTSFGVHNFVFATGKCSQEIEDKFSDVGIISRETEPLGTGGAIKNALKYIKNDHFLVVNGDSYLKFSEDEFKKFVDKYEGLPLIMLTNKKNAVLSSFFKTDLYEYFGTGFYIFPKSVFERIIPNSFSIEHDLIPNCTDKEYFMVDNCSLIDIGTPENLDKANSLMRLWYG
jgi:D-glycero-alpha-D-manno-heptose 1-phosphate guanylyltransferase